MARTATLIVVAAALLIALVVTLPSPASTPVVKSTHMGKTAFQWHRIAEKRRLARDWLQKRLTFRVLEVRALQKVKAPPARDVQYGIHLAATTYGVSETDMHRVASCESGHSATAANGQYRGVFQEGSMFERSRFGRAGFSVWDPVANAMNAAETVSREGWSQWTCKP
jgi:hypothetical protein